MEGARDQDLSATDPYIRCGNFRPQEKAIFRTLVSFQNNVLLSSRDQQPERRETHLTNMPQSLATCGLRVNTCLVHQLQP